LESNFAKNPLIILDLKIGVSWNITPCQLANSLSTFRRYSRLSSPRRMFFLYWSLMIEAASSSEMSVNIYQSRKVTFYRTWIFDFTVSRTANFVIVNLTKVDWMLDSKLDRVTDRYDQANGGVSVKCIAITPRMKRHDWRYITLLCVASWWRDINYR
jgi:hypothetical protein